MDERKLHMSEAQRKVFESDKRMTVTLVGQGVRPSIYLNLRWWLAKQMTAGGRKG